MQINKKAFIIISFVSVAVIIVAMMAATILEKLYGSAFAFRWVYHHPVFILLWGVASLTGLALVYSSLKGRQPWTLLLHASLVLILCGALVTHLSAEEGQVSLPEGETVTAWQRKDGSTAALPCPMRLESFEIERYSGSEAASDYRSRVVADGKTYEISMNHIARIDGYRFYQSGFSDGASVLSINHDPFGIGLTYAGYLLLLVSLGGFFFQRGTRFRQTLLKVARGSALAIGLFLLPSAAQALPKAVPEPVAAAFDDLYIYYNDRVCPFGTMAREYTLKAYGKSHWKDYSASQVVTGWLFYYDWWSAVPFKLKDKDRGTAKEAEKEFLLRSVASGDAWKLYPVADSSGVVRWYNANEPLPVEVVNDYDRWVFIRKMMDLVEQHVRHEDWDEVVRLVGKIKAYQEKEAISVLPSPARIRAEKTYNALSRPLVPFMVSITWGLILFVLLGISLSRNRSFPKWIAWLSVFLAFKLLVYLTLTLGLRWYVSGHAPFAGSYSVMMLMAWLSTLGMCLLWKKYPLVLPLGFLLAGFTMLMASMAGANPQITHLMPVLQSPLLSIHVLTMMLSYTLLGLVALNGIMGLAVPREASARLMDISLVVLYPAVFLLMAGTFLGAVWANISWGNYWGWDPKETWALVTFLVYSFALHGGVLKPFRSPRFFHGFCVLAFLCVLITYFGVNFLLGGMHAYA